MYLFSTERTGLIKGHFNYSDLPQVVWKIKFKQYPIICAESTPVIDDNGNIYFGSHNGSFYCIDKNGIVKWQFVTKGKVYSSPLICDGKVYFCCNGSSLICLDLNGELFWKYDLSDRLRRGSRILKFFSHLYSYAMYDYDAKRFMNMDAWPSPNLLKGKYVVTLLPGVGLVVLDKDTGKLIWDYDFGLPHYHLAGVAIAKKGSCEYIAAVGQGSGLHLFDETGGLLWKTGRKHLTNAWANPSIDTGENSIYYTESYKNKRSFVYKFDFNGRKLWERSFNCGNRSAVTISEQEYVISLGLDGVAYYLNKNNGGIMYSKKIASIVNGLWTSAAILRNGDILVNTKKTGNKGSLICLSGKAETLWEFNYGKALSVPVIDKDGFLYTATWDGDFYKFRPGKS